MAARDAAGSWSDEACEATAKLFVEAAEESEHAVPRYNAGLALLRCKKMSAAKGHFARALEIARQPGSQAERGSAVRSPQTLTRARVKLALIGYEEQGAKGLDAAITEIRQAAVDARFSDAEALTALAMLELKRGGGAADSDGANDFERAKKNIHRALAIDDAYMPAYNQLALYYLSAAKRGFDAAGKTSGKSARADAKALELAALVCSQAVKKDPRFAPIRNTAGLVHMELDNISAAAAAFGEARSIDRTLFEAHMNFAAVNMRFRGFARAEEAYRTAVRLRPNDYDAHLGLALALRAQADAPGDPKAEEAAREIAAAKRIDVERPESYFNEAVLAQELGAEEPGDPNAPLHKAKALFGMFLAKAKSAPKGGGDLTDGIERAKARIVDIEQMIIWRAQTDAERKRADDEMRQREVDAAKKAAEAEEAAKTAEDAKGK
jgi:Tfp pilus assembly protein PilF